MAKNPVTFADLRPPAVLAVGVTGHRSIENDRERVKAIDETLLTIFSSLQNGLATAARTEAMFFSAAPPKLRVLTMGSEGADSAGVRAANTCHADVVLILPFSWDVYRDDFQPASLLAAAHGISNASCRLELPGARDEGSRAYERANDVILSNIDLLIAVWDGKRAQGRAGTGDVVQAAIARHLPVIVVDPLQSQPPAILKPPTDQELDLTAIDNLSKKSLGGDLTDLVAQIVSPPHQRPKRQGLIDLLVEKQRSSAWRIEYPLLLKVLGPRPVKREILSDRGAEALETQLLADRSGHLGPEGAEFSKLELTQQAFDKLAVDYGRLFRSSAVSRYLLVIFGSFVAGIVGLVVPALSGAAIVVQMTINVIVLLDTARSNKRRWQERWLDYRVIAQRLHWIRFLHPMGLGAGPFPWIVERGQVSWTEWFIRRTARGLDPPSGSIDQRMVAAAKARLTQNEIPQQLAYHRLNFRQMQTLEDRLSVAARVMLWASIVVAALLVSAAFHAGGFGAVGWKPIALVLLTFLPASMTALNGIRADIDLVRLVERSAQTIAILSRVRRATVAAAPTYDQVATVMQNLAAIMGHELKEWQFVLESRRSRRSRLKTIRKFRSKRMFRFRK